MSWDPATAGAVAFKRRAGNPNVTFASTTRTLKELFGI